LTPRICPQLFGVITVILATLYPKYPDSLSINRALIIMPIVTGVIATTRSKLRQREKGAACEMAAAKVVCEIYKFRLRALEYDTTAAAAPAGEEEGEVHVGPKQREQRNRERYVDRVQDIYSAVLMSEVPAHSPRARTPAHTACAGSSMLTARTCRRRKVSKGGALNHGGVKDDFATREDRLEMKAQLLRHVQVHLYNRGRNWRRLLLKHAKVAPTDKKARDEVLLSSSRQPEARPRGGDDAGPSSGGRRAGMARGQGHTFAIRAAKAERRKKSVFMKFDAGSPGLTLTMEEKRKQHLTEAAQLQVMIKSAMAETVDDFVSPLQVCAARPCSLRPRP
jgi:hypothetical protein